MYKNILMAYDGSELSDKALNEGIALAKSEGSKLSVIYIMTPHHLMVGGGRAVFGLKQIEQQYVDHLREEAQKMLDAARQKATTAGVSCEALLENGDVAYESIIEAAKRLKCDLIVMASHGRRGVEGLVIGSQTMKVLTHSTIPVLVVR